MPKLKLSKVKAKLKFYVPLLLEFICSGEWTEEREAKVETRAPQPTITPLASLPQDGQMAVLVGSFSAGVILAPILVPTQAEIDLLIQLLH